MSWLNLAIGYPDPDPSGRNRSQFRKVGSQAAEKFMTRHDLAGSAKIIEQWTKHVDRLCGEWHPDIGRASLLMALFFAMRAQYEQVITLTSSALQVLSVLGNDDEDYKVALYLKQQIERLLAGERGASEIAIISRETPAGKFLFDLNPRNL